MNIGTLVSDSPRYSYYISQNDFASMWVKMHADLGYPLKVDSKYRRAIIYNKQGLEKQIQDMIAQVAGNNLELLADLVTDEITTQLNSLTQTANGQFVKKRIRSNNIGALIGKALGKGLVNGFNNLLNDMTDTDRKNKK